ncbi:MAG: hypothetical protein GXO40_00275 [Epsilonproteobacteria bacterium]|nr:hypothetical protein [Campylobacterota bacterium]
MMSQSYKDKIKNSIIEKFAPIGVDEATIEELTLVSIESIEEELKQIDKLLQNNEIDKLGIHTHTIKGILLNVGLNDDALLFKEIKHLSEEGKTDEEIKEITKERLSIFQQ